MKKAIIIGAGPAGLTAALELLERTDIKPIIIEMDSCVGGISRTVNYKGNRLDIGGHRFFSKSEKVMNWWLNIMPLEPLDQENIELTYQNKTTTIGQPVFETENTHPNDVMLLRSRKSRIYYNRQFFDYPISLSLDTLRKLGFWNAVKIGLSYVKSSLFPIKKVENLEQFFINRFGKQLYLTFFKDYTEKVWGKSCTEIDASWGEQRIKGLSIRKAIAHNLKKLFGSLNKDIQQKGTETSLIEQFLYPKYGPGHMWQTVLRKIEEKGGEIHFNKKVMEVDREGDKIVAVVAYDTKIGMGTLFKGDYFFSTMPVKELFNGFQFKVPETVKAVADGLEYRDFFTVGLLVKKLSIKDSKGTKHSVDDNWIYIQEPDVQLGRLQIFNNWSPFMVKNAEYVWMGLEYFCYEKDDIWKWPNEKLVKFGAEELEKIGIIKKEDVLDGVVVRMPKTYPAYFGSYNQFEKIIDYTNQFENLFLVGRNGMHKYNNQDHSMLTAMTAVDNIIANWTDKSNIWAVNTEQEYHEEK
ncbi:MAG: NAD(P)/FAD-dependent oxidoreductase [Chitinophagales bacterium]